MDVAGRYLGDPGRLVRAAFAVLVLALGAASLAVARQDPGGSFGGGSVPSGIAELAGGWSLGLAGLLYWTRHRRNAFGPLLVAAGLGWFLPELSNPSVGSSLGFTAGLVGFVACAPLVAHAALAYPGGKLARHVDRVLLALAYAAALLLLGAFPTAVYDPPAQGCLECPDNLLLLSGDEPLFETLNRWGIRLGLAWTVLLVARIAWRLLRSRAVVSVVAPVAVPAGLYLLLLAWEFRHSLDRGILSNDPFDQRVWRYEGVALTALALGAGWGLVRGGQARASVAQLVLDLARSPRPGGVREALAEALGDPALQLAYARPGSDAYVDAAGRTIELETGRSGRAATPLLREGRPLAVLVHDARLLDDPGLVEGAISGARLAVENEQLQAEVRAQLEDLRASRARIVETGDAERRRLERDLHDGAQQRLVGLSLALRLLRSQLGPDPDADVAARIDEAEGELRQALGELRELAHGIHPAVLTDEGLAAAVEALAEHSPVRIEIGALPEERLPSQVESAAYYTIAEALKGSPTGRAAVDVTREAGRLLVSVVRGGNDGDDGGPVEQARITEMRDRVGALDGTLVVERAELDTLIRAEIPCG